jgi:hypothetical protein
VPAQTSKQVSVDLRANAATKQKAQMKKTGNAGGCENHHRSVRRRKLCMVMR